MSSEGFRQALRVARRELRSGHFREAQSLLDQALQERPDNMAALRVAHDLHHAMRDYDAALAAASRLTDLYPDQPQGHIAAARTLLEIRQIDRAKAHLDKALEQCPTDLNVLHLASDFHRDQRDRHAALDAARQMVKHHADKPDGYARAIQDLVAMNDLEEAQSHLAKVQASHLDHPRVLRAAILVQRALGDHQAALASARLLIDQNPKDFNAQVRAMQASLALEDFDQAKAFLAAARLASKEMADRSMRCVEATIRLYGVSGASKHLSPQPHNPTEEIKKGDKKYIFVSGLARSGTTALGDLLNLSRDITVFFEMLSPSFPYSPSSFNSAYLERALESDRHRERTNASLLEKSKTSAYIGDKRPMFFLRLGDSLQNFADDSVVVYHLVRRLQDVCRSYQARADNPDDVSWNLLHDYREAIIDYELMCNIFLDNARKIADNSHEIVFVPYQKVFTDSEYARSLFDPLTLSDKDNLAPKVEAFVAESKKIATQDRPISAELEQKILDTVDVSKIRKFETLSRCPCL